jgi:transcriptional regulator with XRE-family HTH domain
MSDEWPTLLRDARKRLRLSQAQLASHVGVSAEAVRSYEAGRRKPPRGKLDAIFVALDLPIREANAIRESLGLASVGTRFPGGAYPGYFYTIDELHETVEQATWPEFVLNDHMEVVAANRVVAALWGVDFTHEHAVRSVTELNLLAVAAERRFAERVANWDECVEVMAGIMKFQSDYPDALDNPRPYLDGVLAQFAKAGPEFVERLIKAWVRAEPAVAKCRWFYPMVWDEPGIGVMRFTSLVNTASEPDGLSFNDWIPLDAEAWVNLERVKARGATAK